MGLDWDAPPYQVASAASEASGPIPPPRPVRVVGEVIEPQARRAAELAEMNRRLAANPDDADALIHRGWLFNRQKQWPAAIADLERRLRLRPDDADALYLLATVEIKENDRAAARATLERYLAHVGDDIDARAQKGQMALQLGRLQEADDDFSKVLELEPDRVRVRFDRAQIRLRLGRLEDALADLDALIARYPQDPLLYESRSQVHDRLGHRDRALADLKRVAELPAPALVYNNAAWRLSTGPAAFRDPQQAVALARKAVDLTPGTAIYLNTLGVAQYRASQFAEAIATLEKSLAASKGESDAFDLFFLAMARYRLGRVAEARADFDRAVRWRGHHPNLSQPGWSQELDEFQAEAQDLLYGPLPELPADVFAPPSRP
jgi:tetratricopeptide (TPR) repeat protein